jgi:hypothetical protein
MPASQSIVMPAIVRWWLELQAIHLEADIALSMSCSRTHGCRFARLLFRFFHRLLCLDDMGLGEVMLGLVPRLMIAQGTLTNATVGMDPPAREIQDGFDCIHTWVYSIHLYFALLIKSSTHFPQLIRKLSTSYTQLNRAQTNINVHEQRCRGSQTRFFNRDADQDATIHTRVTVCSANITSAVVLLHFWRARARMGRMRTNTSKLAPGNL